MQQTLKWGLLALFVVLFASCHNHNMLPIPSEHTLLIYISGDNSLSSLADQNIKACGEGLLNSEEPLNLIIYKDNYGKNGQSGYTPSLFLMRADTEKHRIDTVYLKKWSKDLDSSDPKHFAEVVSLVFNTYDTNIKGLEIWGHGRSWIPGSSWNASANSRTAQYACVDSLNYMEIWELADALDQTGIYLDYILFDACFMGTAEVAYELHSNCHWMMGAPCEVPDKGFPYAQYISQLSAVTGKLGENVMALQNALQNCINSFSQRYPDRGAMSLFNEKNMESLHEAYKNVLSKNAVLYSAVADEPYSYDTQLQHYGRSATGDRYHFYDFADFMALSGADLSIVLNNAVTYHFAAPQYYDGAGTVTIDHSCGMAITPPQFFSISELRNRLIAAYPLLKWSKN